ncbi:hypothetical protein GW17_00056392 [Ensete ventricosum]|nr:hypothetical protein GW17_00056392 [Ensete ventricosum]
MQTLVATLRCCYLAECHTHVASLVLVTSLGVFSPVLGGCLSTSPMLSVQ